MTKEKMQTVEQNAPAANDQEFYHKMNQENAHRAQLEEQRAKRAEDAERVRHEVRRHRRRHKATREYITRLVTGLAIWVGSYLASTFGLCQLMLALAISAGVLAWVTFWTGAWIQYMWPKGGLFDGETE